MKKILCWNVNGIRAIAKKGAFQEIIQKDYDFFCFQETKAHPEQLEKGLVEVPSFHSYWASAKRRGYSGLVTYSKEKPLDVEFLGQDEFDDEGRVLILHFDHWSLLNAYFPNSQEKGKRIDYKLAFCDAILEKAQNIRSKGQNLVLCGDYNIAHTEIDLKNPDENRDSPGFLPEECAWMEKYLQSGFVDTFRIFEKDGGHYTWWSYRTRARERNAGWRIDYHCVNQEFADRVLQSPIHDEILGSDHCPVGLEIDL